MKALAIILMASLLVSDSYVPPIAQKGAMRVDRIIDAEIGVVCYVAQNTGGSSHTTPSMQCFYLPGVKTIQVSK